VGALAAPSEIEGAPGILAQNGMQLQGAGTAGHGTGLALSRSVPKNRLCVLDVTARRSGLELALVLVLLALLLPAGIAAAKVPARRAARDNKDTATLTLVRHGQSTWNLQNRFTGWVDVPLTRKGRAEARRAGTLVRDIRFDRAYTSGLQRAQDSLKLMMQTYGAELPVKRSKALNERHYGLLQGLNKAETARRVGEKRVHRWRRSWDVAPPGGESLKQTAERTMPYFERHILRDLQQGKNVLVVAHGNSLRSIVASLEGLSPEQVPQLQIETGVPLVYRVGRDGRVVSKDVRH
jgi:2,3-bisphosphoglycerate-dependent phosphoglycerate mutase